MIVALLLATLSLAGVSADSHGHGHEELQVRSVEHEPLDRTLRIADASRTDSESCFGCIGCLPQQRQLAVGTFVPTLVGLEPDVSTIAIESVRGLRADTRQLKPSRAPPRV